MQICLNLDIKNLLCVWREFEEITGYVKEYVWMYEWHWSKEKEKAMKRKKVGRLQ